MADNNTNSDKSKSWIHKKLKSKLINLAVMVVVTLLFLLISIIIEI